MCRGRPVCLPKGWILLSDLNRHHRHTIRLKEFDYSSNDIYYVTIVTQDRQCIFGDIIDGIILLNQAGCMIDRWLNELPNKFPGIIIDSYVIMPNHVHFLIIHVGADLCVCTNEEKEYIPPKLAGIVQWFKTMTTNDYIRGVRDGICPSFNKRIWQRDYYEHIIRNYAEFQEKREYIKSNPSLWNSDEHHPKFGPYLESSNYL